MTKAIRSVHVRVPLTGAQFPVDDYNACWGDIVRWCNAHQKAGRYTAHHAMYHDLRATYPKLLAQMVIIALREATAAVKSWNSNHPKRKWKLRAKRRSRGLTMDARLMQLRGNLLTVSTSNGQKRWRTMLVLPEWFVVRYPERTLQAIVVRPDGEELVITCLFAVPTAKPRTTGKTVGLDRGIKKAVVTSEGGVITSASTRAVRRRYAHNRRTLQTKGTRSARRRLRAMSGREKRFVSDFNHRATKMLASDVEVSTYVIEDLTSIGRKKRKGKSVKKMRTWLSNWAYAQFEFQLRYKCAAAGIAVVAVSPAYTSQQCHLCGTIDRRNRKGARFDCVRCGHSDDADINAAKNIRDRHNPAIDGGTGCLSTTHMDGASAHVQATGLAPVVS